jgi:hypothetical protein
MFGFPAFAGGTDAALRAGAAPTPTAPPFEPLAEFATGSPVGLYSARLLNANYSGPLFQLLRSSDNAIQDFRAVAETGEINTAEIDTWLGGSDGQVTVLYDQSVANNADMRSMILDSSPIGSNFLYSSSIAQLGGRPGFRTIDASLARLSTGFVPTLTITSMPPPHTFIGASVFTHEPSGGSSLTSILTLTALPGGFVSVRRQKTLSIPAQIAPSYSTDLRLAIDTEDDPKYFSFIHSATDVTFRLNGASTTPVASPGYTVATENMQILASSSSTTLFTQDPRPIIYIGDVLIYGSDKTADLAAIEANIVARYGF